MGVSFVFVVRSVKSSNIENLQVPLRPQSANNENVQVSLRSKSNHVKKKNNTAKQKKNNTKSRCSCRTAKKKFMFHFKEAVDTRQMKKKLYFKSVTKS
jgi:hypothetical protein